MLRGQCRGCESSLYPIEEVILTAPDVYPERIASSYDGEWWSSIVGSRCSEAKFYIDFHGELFADDIRPVSRLTHVGRERQAPSSDLQ